jgi:hypothetical protein
LKTDVSSPPQAAKTSVSNVYVIVLRIRGLGKWNQKGGFEATPRGLRGNQMRSKRFRKSINPNLSQKHIVESSVSLSQRFSKFSCFESPKGV